MEHEQSNYWKNTFKGKSLISMKLNKQKYELAVSLLLREHRSNHFLSLSLVSIITCCCWASRNHWWWRYTIIKRRTSSTTKPTTIITKTHWTSFETFNWLSWRILWSFAWFVEILEKKSIPSCLSSTNRVRAYGWIFLYHAPVDSYNRTSTMAIFLLSRFPSSIAFLTWLPVSNIYTGNGS